MAANICSLKPALSATLLLWSSDLPHARDLLAYFETHDMRVKARELTREQLAALLRRTPLTVHTLASVESPAGFEAAWLACARKTPLALAHAATLRTLLTPPAQTTEK